MVNTSPRASVTGAGDVHNRPSESGPERWLMSEETLSDQVLHGSRAPMGDVGNSATHALRRTGRVGGGGGAPSQSRLGSRQEKPAGLAADPIAAQ